MEDDIKFQQMQDEMSRFEAEISGDRLLHAPPRPVIGVNTYSSVQHRLEQQGPGAPLLPPPPPPPMMGFDMMGAPSGMMGGPGAMMGGPGAMMFGNIPPPPPPPTMLVPPQVRARMAPPPSGFPGPYMMPSMPHKPQPAVLSGAPQLYKNKPEKVKKKASPTVETSKETKEAETPAPAPSSYPPPAPTPAPSPAPQASTPSEAPQQHNTQHKAGKKEKKNRKVIRTAGGQVWEDLSLMEWGEEDFRLFCGDLGNDVTDELLIRTFSKYSSFSKAKVVRDKRTNKSKGFGFISFKEPADFIKAMKEMNGRYVGSRPIKLRKSSWKNRSLDVVRKKEKEKAALISLLTSGSSKP